MNCYDKKLDPRY